MKKYLYSITSFASMVMMAAVTTTITVGCDGKPTDGPDDERTVKINEAYSRGKDGNWPLDWVELYNPSDKAVDISGWVLSDKADMAEKVTVAAGTSLPSRGFLIVEVDIEGGFGLSSGGDAVYLYDKAGEQVDLVEFGEMELDQSWSANPDGSAAFRMQSPTPGASNNTGKVVPLVNIVSQTPASPTSEEAVVVTTIVSPREGELSSVVIRWAVDGAGQTEIRMTEDAESGTWKGTIPAQAAGVTVNWEIAAVNSVGGKAEAGGSYSVRGTLEVDYKGLVINEVDGNGKFVELYNMSGAEISLSGVVLVKNGEDDAEDLWWTGGAVAIAAGDYYTICEKDGDLADSVDEATGNGGISPKKNIRFELVAPDGERIDVFTRSDEMELDANCAPDYGNGTAYSFARCPDGEGAFGLAVPSCDAKNPSEAAGEIVTNAPVE